MSRYLLQAKLCFEQQAGLTERPTTLEQKRSFQRLFGPVRP